MSLAEEAILALVIWCERKSIRRVLRGWLLEEE
jgi:hypothetical protein